MNGKKIQLFTEDGEFNVDGQRCDNYIMCPLRPISEETCPHDYIRVYDGNSESSVIIGTFCGIGRFPFSIVGTSNELLLEFVSSPAGPLLNTGFHFNIDSWPGNVGNVFGQQMQQDPNEKQLGNRTKANPTCSFVLTSSGLEGSGDPEVSRLSRRAAKRKGKVTFSYVFFCFMIPVSHRGDTIPTYDDAHMNNSYLL